MQVLAVCRPIWRPMALAYPLAERQNGKSGACRRIMNLQGVGCGGLRPKVLGSAEVFKDTHAVRADLDAGAFFCKNRAAFEHAAGNSARRKGECSGQPANAATGNQDGLIQRVALQGCVPLLGASRRRS